MFNLFAKQPQIEAEEVKKSIDGKADFILLDVRTAGEFSGSRISGSINLPVDEIASKVEDLIPDKEKTIYAYCLSGSRSDQAAGIMQQLGYKNSYSMKSGLLAWRAKNFPLEENS